MIAKVIVSEAGDFVELILLYQSEDIRKSRCLNFKMHGDTPNCVSHLTRALITCWFYKIVCVFSSWMAFVRLCKSTY
jgi:hypothetical protein